MATPEQVEQFTQRLDALQQQTFNDAVKTEAESIIAGLPGDATGDAKVKASFLVARARARLLLPAYSKEAEQDLSKALKLRPNDLHAWVAMSECLWKRDALKEARDALNSALSIDPKCVKALCQLSRIQRAFCGRKDTTNEERVALMEESIAKAKEATGIDLKSGEAWATLGVALIQHTVATGMDLVAMKKANQALTQAARLRDSDPDVFYNRGVVRKALGDFGAASSDFAKAFELDPVGLPVAKRDEQSVSNVLNGFHGVVAAYSGDSDSQRMRDFKKNVLSKLPLVGDRGSEFSPVRLILNQQAQGRTLWSALRVVELVSPQSDQPLCYMAVDREGTFCALLVYRLLHQAIKAGDTVFVSFPPSSVAQHSHTFRTPVTKDKATGQQTGGDERTLTLPSVVADPTAIFVNGAPVAKSMIKMPLLATRQFV